MKKSYIKSKEFINYCTFLSTNLNNAVKNKFDISNITDDEFLNVKTCMIKFAFYKKVYFTYNYHMIALHYYNVPLFYNNNLVYINNKVITFNDIQKELDDVINNVYLISYLSYPNMSIINTVNSAIKYNININILIPDKKLNIDAKDFEKTMTKLTDINIRKIYYNIVF